MQPAQSRRNPALRNTLAVEDSSDTLPHNLQSSVLNARGEEEAMTDANNSNSNNDSDNPKKLQKASVSFSTVRVHHHRLSLGDNPGVSSGIPLTLAWEYEQSETLQLDDVEKEKQALNKHVRRIPRTHREEIAAERHSRDSIVLAQEQVRELQRSREDSERDPLSCSETCQIKKTLSKNKKRGFLRFLFGKRK